MAKRFDKSKMKCNSPKTTPSVATAAVGQIKQLTPLDTHIVSAIVGLYFGAGFTK